MKRGLFSFSLGAVEGLLIFFSFFSFGKEKKKNPAKLPSVPHIQTEKRHGKKVETFFYSRKSRDEVKVPEIEPRRFFRPPSVGKEERVGNFSKLPARVSFLLTSCPDKCFRPDIGFAYLLVFSSS